MRQDGKSSILGGMLRKGPRVSVAIGVGRGGNNGPGAPSGHEEPPPEHMMEPGGHAMESGGDMQMAYDKAVEGLQEIAKEYPEASDILKTLEERWAVWMGGEHAMKNAEPPAAGEPPSSSPPRARLGQEQEEELPPEEPPGDALLRQSRHRVGAE